MPLKVAIVGAGPAGFYTADALLKSDTECEIDIIERLPCPFGLIRFGVAPDHEKTRNVSRAFAKTAENEAVRYFGNVEVGRDVSIEELLDTYDAVVLTVGAGKDRPLDLPGADKAGVYGSATFVNWYNAHPDAAGLAPDLNTEAAVVIGAGNVAIDVARVLLKTPAEMAATDLAAHAAAPIHAAPMKDVYMVARRSAAEAKFTNVELREMGELDEVVPQIDGPPLPEAVEGEMSDRDRRVREKNLGTLQEFAGRAADEKPKRVHFVFCAQPVELLGDERVSGVRFERTRMEDGRAVPTGETFDIACGLVVAATGYRSDPVPGAPFDEAGGIIPNDEGRVAERLYTAGWVKRGPSGVIGTNKVDGQATAKLVLEDLGSGAGRPGREALGALLAERGCRVVNFDDWKTIQAAEEAAATDGAPRAKFATVDAMLAVLESGTAAAD